MKPLLKWVGGKTQIITEILDNFPKEINNYYEPFLGGGTVILSVLNSEINIKGNIYANDSNETLLTFYRELQTNPTKLYEEIRILFEEYSKCDFKEKFYYDKRTEFNSIKTNALFYFLNKTSFRGLYRVNSKGEFNVPFGNYKNLNLISREEFLEYSSLIKNVIFTCCDFREVLGNQIGKEDFVYLDPPYYPVNKTSFTYNNFENETDHEELFELTKNLKGKFLMSNSDTDFVKESFKGYHIKVIECRRAINNTKANEVLISL